MRNYQRAKYVLNVISGTNRPILTIANAKEGYYRPVTGKITPTIFVRLNLSKRANR